MDEQSYAYNEKDAGDLINLLSSPQEEFNQWHPVSNDGGSGATLYKATMKATWSAGVVSCDIYSIDGVTFTDTGTDANVYDGLGIFSTLTTGDDMLVLLQAGKYYAIQAPCP